MSRRTAIYPGTFDPITKGHVDLIERGVKLYDHLIVAVAEHPSKDTLFSVDERIDLISKTIKGHKNITVEGFDGLLIDYVAKKKSGVILRGLRVISDFEYEFQMALTNRQLAGEIETVFMMTKEEFAPVSSRFIKEIARLGGDVRAFVPATVARSLKKKYRTTEEK